MNEFNIIKNLKNNKDIEQFIKYRLFILENKDIDKIGINTGVTIYSDFLGDKITYNIGATINDDTEKIKELFKLKFDDNNIYKKLIKVIRNNSGNQLLDNPYYAVYIVIRKYLSYVNLSKIPKRLKNRRDLVYIRQNKFTSEPVSLKKFHWNRLSMCAECAGAAHNMFKFLGLDCDLVTGGISGINHQTLHELHAFNILYPEGRDTYAIIFDSSYISDPIENPTIFYIDKETKEDLLSYKKIIVNEKNITKGYKKTLGFFVSTLPMHSEYSILKDAYVETIVAQKKDKNKKLELKKEKK